MSKKQSALAMGTVVLMTAGVVVASDLESEARIAALETQVAELRGEGWMNDQRADEVRAIVADVLADADTRSSMLQGMTAGYDDGFVLGSADGNFKLKVNGYAQIRYVLNYLDTEDDSDTDSTRNGFENAHTYLIFSGHVVDPSWQYLVSGAFEADGGAMTLDEAYIRKVLDNGWSGRVGQYKDPFLREELVDDTYQLAVDRSIVTEFFTHGYTQGGEVAYTGDTLRFMISTNDGPNSENTSALTPNVEFAVAARADFLFAGNWEQFDDFTSPQGSEYGAMVGVAAAYSRGESGTPDPEIERFDLTADVSSEGDGWNVFAAFVWSSLDDDTTGGVDNDPWAIVAQGGYYFTEDLEGYVRYEFGDLDDLGGADDDLMVMTVGVNKYFAGHTLKWSTDVGYAFDGVEATWDDNASIEGVGWRTDDDGNDGQLVFRTQLQLAF